MHRLAVGLGDLPQLVRPRRRPQLLRQLGATAGRGRRSRGARRALSASRPPIPWPIDDDARAEPLDRRDDVVGVGVERQAGRVGGLRPEVVAQVERVALPAAAGEVAEEALPEPRSGELAVDEQQRPAARSALRAATTRCTGRARRARSRPCGPGGRRSSLRGSVERRGGGGNPPLRSIPERRPESRRACYTSARRRLGRPREPRGRRHHSCGLMTRPVTGLG